MQKYYVYILKSLVDDKLYTGMTTNIDKRFIEHELKKSKYTSYTSKQEHLVLIYYSVFIGKNAKDRAVKFEKYLKSGSGRAFAKKHLV